MRRADLATVLTVTLVWGVAFVGIKDTLQFWPPLLLAGTRFALAGAVLFLLLNVRMRRGRLRPRGRAPRLSEAVVVGLLQTTGLYACSFLGTQRATAGVAALIVNMSSLWVALLAMPLLGERLRATTIGGVAAALVGVALVSVQTATASAAGIVFLLLGSVSWALGSIAIKRLPAVDPARLAAAQMLVGAVPLLVTGLLLEARPRGFDAEGWAWFAFLVVPAGALGFATWFSLLARYGAGPISAWLLLIPLWGVLAGAVLLDEQVTWRLVLGGALVLGGVVLAGTRAREITAAEPPA